MAIQERALVEQLAIACLKKIAELIEYTDLLQTAGFAVERGACCHYELESAVLTALGLPKENWGKGSYEEDEDPTCFSRDVWGEAVGCAARRFLKHRHESVLVEFVNDVRRSLDDPSVMVRWWDGGIS